MTTRDLEKQGTPQETLSIYRRSLKDYAPQGTVYFERPAILFERLGQFDEALPVCRRAVKVISAGLFRVETEPFERRRMRLEEERHQRAATVSSGADDCQTPGGDMRTMHAEARRIPGSFPLIVLFTILVAVGALASRETGLAQEPSIAVVVNESPILLSAPPIVANGQVLLPLRETFSMLDAHVTWIPDTRSIVAYRGGTVVGMRVDSEIADVNGDSVILAAPPRLVNGKVMVPLRTIATAFGADVTYANRTAIISLAPLEDDGPAPRRYYELIDNYAKEAFVGRRVWAKNFDGRFEMTVDRSGYSGGSIPLAHLEPLKILAICPIEADQQTPWRTRNPKRMRLVQLEDDKGRVGWVEINDYNYYSYDEGFHYQEALGETFFLEDPRKKYNWASATWQLIEANRIQLGMTPDMVKLSWGEPRRVNRTISAFGVHEQWVYHDSGPYVYFENGTLTTIQD